MLAVLTLCVLSIPVIPAGEPFSELGYEAALAQAKQEEKLLLVDFTASWCGPCKKMEKDTWAASEVKTWLAANAVAVQVDVDEDKARAKAFEVRAMPTVVALRDGVEFDRFVGYRDAAGFLSWAREVRAGKKPSEALLERSKALQTSTDVDARYESARAMLQAKQYDEALAHYLWLWPATREASGFGGVRTSFMLSDMATLADRHAPARTAFDGIFADLQQRVDAAELPSFDDWQEWTAFCRTFDGKKRVLAWYEARRDAEGRLFAGRSEHMAEQIVEDVFEALMAAERASDAVRLYPDALPYAERCVGDYVQDEELRSDPGRRAMDEEMAERMAAFARSKLVQRLSRLFAALHAAGRDEEATRVAALLLQTLDTPEARLALVREALGASQTVHPQCAAWLDQAEAAGANTKPLRRKLAKRSGE